jgi:phosphotransferase system HPr-like phosphotransfer protein
MFFSPFPELFPGFSPDFHENSLLTFFPYLGSIYVGLAVGSYPAVTKNTETIKEVLYMKTVRISLNSIDKVKSFVNDLTKFDVDFDLVSGRYVIDAKSIMGIFSLDLSKPIDLNIHAEAGIDEILETLAPYIIQ